MPDIFDFLDSKVKNRENEPEIRAKESVDFLKANVVMLSKLADAIRDMKPPVVTVTNKPAEKADPVSYRFIVNRDSRGFIESLDATVIKK